MLFSDVVIRVPICTKDNSLADEVKRVCAVAEEAAVSRIEVVCLAKRSNRGIVVRGVIEYKVTQSIAGYTVYLERFGYSLCNYLDGMGTSKLS
jgi:hypothetical protein